MKTLVTGANGHLGANIVRALLDQGHTVRAFVRDRSDLQGLAGLDVEIAKGDLLYADSLKRAAEGCQWLFHAGAVYRNFSVNAHDIIAPAVTGTRNAIEAAAAAGVERFVHTSSNATIGYPRDARSPSTSPTGWRMPMRPTSEQNANPRRSRSSAEPS